MKNSQAEAVTDAIFGDHVIGSCEDGEFYAPNSIVAQQAVRASTHDVPGSTHMGSGAPPGRRKRWIEIYRELADALENDE